MWCDDENNNADCNFDGGACCFNEAQGWDNYCSVGNFFAFNFYIDHINFKYLHRIVSALSVNQLDGMGITTVMTNSILEIVNMTEEIAAVITCLLPTAR